ncbi:MAG: hypothetical protein FWF00_04785 [Endomicrobia bacterium]|nr:hypothetical protein [Endomicrobiia bacterium]MCL2506985.1 hypothetical protein [Endomicrobiia bacterium]
MLKKFIAFFVSFCFIISSLPGEVFSSQTTGAAPSVHNNKSISLVPQDMANVMCDFYFGSDNTIINIQDLHSDYSTQKNIADIIDYLNENHEISSIYLEGAYGAINMNWLKEETDSVLREAIAKRLLKDGKISGAEYFLINNTKTSIKFEGIENEAVYLENFKILGQMFDKEAENTELINYIQNHLSKLTQTRFSAKNKSLYKLKQKYKLGKISEKRYYSALEKAAKKSDIPYFNYRYISQYNSTVKSLDKINGKKLSKELKTISDDLKNDIPYKEYRQISELAQNHPLEYIKKISSYLSDSGKSGKYPNIKNYTLFLTALDSFDYRSLLIQEDYLSRELLYANARTKNEEDLIFTENYTSKLLNMLTNKLLSEDYVYMTESDNFAKYSILLENYIPAAYINDIKIQFSIASKFYENNLLRNNYFLSNALGAPVTTINPSGARQSLALKNSFDLSLADMLKTTNAKIDILVSGGFHLQGMQDLMNVNSVNYAIVMPAVTSFDTKQTEILFKRDFHIKKEIMRNAYKVFVTGSIFNIEWQDPLKVIFSNFLNFSLLDEIWKHTGDKNDYITDTLNNYLSKILSDKKISQTAKITKLHKQDENTFVAEVLIGNKETREVIISANEGSVITSSADAGAKKKTSKSSTFGTIFKTTLMLLTLGITGVGGAGISSGKTTKKTAPKEKNNIDENARIVINGQSIEGKEAMLSNSQVTFVNSSISQTEYIGIQTPEENRIIFKNINTAEHGSMGIQIEDKGIFEITYENGLFKVYKYIKEITGQEPEKALVYAGKKTNITIYASDEKFNRINDIDNKYLCVIDTINPKKFIAARDSWSDGGASGSVDNIYNRYVPEDHYTFVSKETASGIFKEDYSIDYGKLFATININKIKEQEGLILDLTNLDKTKYNIDELVSFFINTVGVENITITHTPLNSEGKPVPEYINTDKSIIRYPISQIELAKPVKSEEENEYLKYLPGFERDVTMFIWPVESAKLTYDPSSIGDAHPEDAKFELAYEPFTKFIESAKNYKAEKEKKYGVDVIFFIPAYMTFAFQSYYKDKIANKDYAQTDTNFKGGDWGHNQTLSIIKIDGMTFAFYPEGNRGHNENAYLESLTNVYHQARKAFDNFLDNTKLPWRDASIKYFYHDKEYTQENLNIDELLINANPSIKKGFVAYIFYELQRVLTDIYNSSSILTDALRRPISRMYMKGNWVMVYREQNYDIDFLRDYFKVIRRHGFEASLILPTRDKNLISENNSTLVRTCFVSGNKAARIYKQQIDGKHSVYFIDVSDFPQDYDGLWLPEVLKEIKPFLTKYSNNIIEFKGTPAIPKSKVNTVFEDSYKSVVTMSENSSQEDKETVTEMGFPFILQQSSIADRANPKELKYPHVAASVVHTSNVVRVVKALKRKSFLGLFTDQKASIVGVKIASDEHIFNSLKEESEFISIMTDIGVDFVNVVIRDNNLDLKVLSRDTTVKENLKKLAADLRKIDKKILFEYTFTRIDEHFDDFLDKFETEQKEIGYAGVKFDLFDCNEKDIEKFIKDMRSYTSRKPDLACEMSVYVSEKMWNKFGHTFLTLGITRILSSKEELMDNDYALNSFNSHYEISVYKNQHEYERKIQHMIHVINNIYYRAKNPDGSLNYGEIPNSTIRNIIEKWESSNQPLETILKEHTDTVMMEDRLLNIMNKVLNSREITRVTFPINLVYSQPLKDTEREGLDYNMNVINSMVSFMRYMKETKGIVERKYFAYKFARMQKIKVIETEEEANKIADILRKSGTSGITYIKDNHPYFFDFVVESKRTLHSMSRSFLLGLYTEYIKNKYLEGAYGDKIYILDKKDYYDNLTGKKQDLFDRFMAYMILYKDKMPYLTATDGIIDEDGIGILFDINKDDLVLMPNPGNKMEIEIINELITDIKKYNRAWWPTIKGKEQFFLEFFDKYFSQFDGHIEKDLYGIRVGMMLVLAASDLKFIDPVVPDIKTDTIDVDRMGGADQLDILNITAILTKA